MSRIIKNGKRFGIWALIMSLLFLLTPQAEAEQADSIPQGVLDACDYVVQVNMFFEDEKGDIIDYYAGPGVIGMRLNLDGYWTHVITSRDFIYMFDTVNDYQSYRFSVFMDGEDYEVEQTGFHKEKKQDIGIVYLKDTLPGDNFAKFIGVSEMHVGDTVYAIGFQKKTDDPKATVANDNMIIVSGSILDLGFEYDGLSYIVADIPFDENLIGGPLVDENGNVVGLISRMRDQNRDRVYVTSGDDIFNILMEMNLPAASVGGIVPQNVDAEG